MLSSRTTQTALRSIFGIDFECSSTFDGNTRLEIRPLCFPKTKGVRLSFREVYPNSFRADFEFDAFSRGLYETLFCSEEAANCGYSFIDALTNNVGVDIRVNGIQKLTGGDFFAAREAGSNTTPGKIRATLRFDDGDRLENALVSAIAITGFVLTLAGMIRIEPLDDGAIEGEAIEVVSKKYERSAKNRAACILHHGTACYVCGFDFGNTYGDFARGFIEVHHKIQLSTLDKKRAFDPINDLVPLCPNCHRAVHLSTPPFDPDFLKQAIASREL